MMEPPNILYKIHQVNVISNLMWTGIMATTNHIY